MSSTAITETLSKFTADELHQHLEAVEQERELTIGLIRLRRRQAKRWGAVGDEKDRGARRSSAAR